MGGGLKAFGEADFDAQNLRNADISPYEFNLSDFKTSPQINWSEVDSLLDRTIEVKMPDGSVKYFQYSYKDNSYPIKENEIYIKNESTVGGVLNNASRLSEYNGDFISNLALGHGGAIYNINGEIGEINGNFISNYANTLGGAIANNNGLIDVVNANFISNTSLYGGGAIALSGATINNINGKFVSNSAQNFSGGAIANSGSVIGKLNGSFVSNSSFIEGGAIYNYGSFIDSLEADFVNNSAENETADVKGGAISNIDSIISSLSGNFINNYAKGKNALGGAIYSNDFLQLSADKKDILFSGNYTISSGVKENNAIYMDSGASGPSVLFIQVKNDGSVTFDDKINGVSGFDLVLNGDGKGRVVFNDEVKNANINLNNTTLKLGNENAIANSASFLVTSGVLDLKDDKTNAFDLGNMTLNNNLKIIIDADLENAKADSISANNVVNSKDYKILISQINITKETTENSALSLKVASDNLKNMVELSSNPDVKIEGAKDNYYLIYDKTSGELMISDSVFLKYALSQEDENRVYVLSADENVSNSLGQMAKDNSTLTIDGNNNSILAQNVDGIIVSNTQTLNINDVKEISGFKDDVAIENNGVVNLSNTNLKNKIQGSNSALVSIKDDVVLSSEIKDNNISLDNGYLTLENASKIENASSLIANGGGISLQDGQIGNKNLGNLVLNSDLNLKLDADFQAKEIDKIAVNNLTTNNNSINITDIKILAPTSDASFSLSPIDLEGILSDDVKTNLKNSIKYTGSDLVYSPIFKYSAKYDPKSAMLNFSLLNNANPQKPTYEALNPAVLSSSVAQLGGYLTQLNSYEEAFYNMDTYMLLSKEERQALKLQQQLNLKPNYENKYASISLGAQYNDVKDKFHKNTAYFRPYTIIEKVPLKNGPKVNNTMYGSYFGTESKIKQYKNFDVIYGLYLGYNGSRQTYDKISNYQNGATLGLNTFAYKNNFFQGLTLNIGADGVISDTLYKKDNYSMLRTGIASKTGYNFEFKQGKYIIQPNFMLSYSFINTQDYTNSQNVKIKSNPLNAIHLEPGIKFIANLQNKTLQPYLNISMNFNILDKTNFRANNVSLPDLSIKPYIKYGIGIQKTLKERFTGFFTTYVTNGGRNGVGLQGGLGFLF